MMFMDVIMCVYMWHHADHPVIWVVHSQGSTAIFGQFHDNMLRMRRVQGPSSYFQMLHHQ